MRVAPSNLWHHYPVPYTSVRKNIMPSTPQRVYRLFAIAEVFSWTLLILGLILRYTMDLSLALTIGGSVHGFIFLCYGATVVFVSLNQRWKIYITILGIASAIVPYATVPMERWLWKKGLLDGEWRFEETDDPRDKTWIDRIFRYFLSKPLITATLLLLGVIISYVVLLIIGPPGGR